MAEDPGAPETIDTSLGPIEYLIRGSGPAVLFVHGSPGGCDQGELMTRFLVAAGTRVVLPSRPGYLGTPLGDGNATPDQQALMLRELMDSLGIDRFGVMCWSGGGPSSYRLVAAHPARVRCLVAVAAVSRSYTFEGGLEAKLMEGKVGRWLIDRMAHLAPRSLVNATVSEEGDLDKAQLRELTRQIWDDETKRAFVLDLAATVAGRNTGLENDHRQFPRIGDLDLGAIAVPTLLIHGTADSDVPPEYSEHARTTIPGAEIVRIDGGTHIALWTDATSDTVQARVAEFLLA